LPPAEIPAVHFARDYDDAVVAARVRTGRWERVARGAYTSTALRSSPRRRSIARIIAVDHQLQTAHWFSHESAAVIWGLPLWREPQRVQVRQAGHASSQRDRSVARHRGLVDAARLTSVGGLAVTDLVQTAVDCACTLRPLEGLVVADGALRAGADRAAALALLDDLTGHRGIRRARAVIGLADGGAESPGETATRFVLLRARLPVPRTQIEVTTRLGTFWADLGWEEWRVLIEYDGRPKYRSVDDLIREKRRHDALLEAGWRVLRVTKEDLRSPAALLDRVERTLPAGVIRTPRPALRA
jgi:very-short-patch-repair endonuclease